MAQQQSNAHGARGGDSVAVPALTPSPAVHEPGAASPDTPVSAQPVPPQREESKTEDGRTTVEGGGGGAVAGSGSGSQLVLNKSPQGRYIQVSVGF